MRVPVLVENGPGRLWVAAASRRGQAWAVGVTYRRIRVEYITGGGRTVRCWVPAQAVRGR